MLIKCYSLPNKMCCVLNVLFFAMLCQNTILHSINSTVKSTPQESEDVRDIIQLGKGIDEVPVGSGQSELLNLAYNHISVLHECVFWNKSYRILSEIDLNQNKIANINVLAFKGLKQLSRIVLSDNNLTSLDPYTFKHNNKLEKIDLSGNKIAFDRVKVFLVQQNLETLILSRNRIEQIYELTFMALPNLKNLVLDDNILNIIDPNSFKSLSKLQYLSLANTGVYRLSKSMFGHNRPRIIDLRETPIAKRFDPPLRIITNNAVNMLIKFSENLLK